ncbi:MAG: hypothetical protein SH819_07870 [Cytophagales bacterium]|nr:hypothetical protein [Cytophagales bacterium]
MKNRSLSIAVLVVPVLLFLSTGARAQFSIGANFGVAVAESGGDDFFSLNKAWPTVGTGSGPSSGSGGIPIAKGGSGNVLNFNLTWEASRILGISLVYRTISLTMPENSRTAGTNSLGVQFKVNFVKNTNKVVPFFQGGFFFTNSNTLKQTLAVSSQYPTQTMPAFEKSYSTGAGFSADLGVEFKLNQSFALVVQGGLNGADYYSGDDTFAKSLNMNSSNPSPNSQYISPSNFDGVFWLQATGGIKYYLGRGTKKRDF